MEDQLTIEKGTVFIRGPSRSNHFYTVLFPSFNPGSVGLYRFRRNDVGFLRSICPFNKRHGETVVDRVHSPTGPTSTGTSPERPSLAGETSTKSLGALVVT